MLQFKSYFSKTLLVPSILALMACSTNPATGERQFAALMSPQQENQVGASEHEKIVQQFGLIDNPALSSYVQSVGQKVTANTERPDVQYKFYVIDSPIVNAFALPGGYIYISRGLLALANSEAELASVLGHEAGHITGRHSAERYSHGVVTTLGAGLISAALGSDTASQALGVGANLYLSSYSRDQENEADTLGLRYMARGGYAPSAVPSFLSSLQRQSELEARIAGRSSEGISYFSTHPATGARVQKTRAEAGSYPQGGVQNEQRHLQAISGMIYGDSPSHGFIRGQSFYHPKMGFTFSVPRDFKISNQATQVVATNQQGSAIIFDMGANSQNLSPMQYIRSVWLKDAPLQGVENITVNGLPGATASFTGQVNGQPVTVRAVAIMWGQGFARFQMAIPSNASAALIDGLKRTTYSFRSLSAQEKTAIKPLRVALYTAKAGDSSASVASLMAVDEMKLEHFLIMNGLQAGQPLIAGRVYKIVTEG